MKPALIILICAVALFVAFAAFAPEDNAPFKIMECKLKVDKALITILSTGKDIKMPASVGIGIFDGKKEIAIGCARLEILKLPETSLTVNIPLSKELVAGKNYSVKVKAQTGNNIEFDKEFASCRATGTSSQRFFKKSFQVIPELSQPRKKALYPGSAIEID